MTSIFKAIYFCLFLTAIGYSQTTTNDTINVDFGSLISEGTWNNLSEPGGDGEITMLKNSRNLFTGMGINIYERFNGINTGGTTSPDSNLGFPSNATSDSYYGNTASWQGLIIPEAGVLISGLNPVKEYTFEVFASRVASDNRETQYKFDGALLDSVVLDPSNNTANTVSVTMQPKGDGTIDLTVSPGANNNNSFGFYYLGALKIIYEQEEGLPPALAITSPNGGEELAGATNHFITWDPINLSDDIVVSFSTNNGTSWEDIATVGSSANSLSWSVPNINSENCLVRAASGSTSDHSDSIFTITSSVVAATDTIQVDFGSNLSGDGWNNFSETGGDGEIPALINSKSFFTDIGATFYDRFNGINTSGTSSPDLNLRLPSSATGDSYYGNTQVFASLIEPTAGLSFTGLDVSKQYTFEVFASRMGVSDNRETKYKFTGSLTDSVYLNPSNNETDIATITLQPAPDGSIDLMVTPGENNDNSFGFYYLGSLKVIYEQDEISTSISVTAPNGGEEWVKGSDQKITWVSSDVNNVKIEFSADNGVSWDSLGASQASLGSFDWLVPEINTDSALVKITALEDSEVFDISNSVFKIDDPINGEFRPVIVVLGSSTAAGSGASSNDSSWVGRYRKHIRSLDESAYIVNLAVGGFTSYDIMPSGFTPPAGRPVPQTDNNITKALTYKPWAIIINLPSNDANAGYTQGEQVFNMTTITQTAADAEVPVWVTTTQPRNFSEEKRQSLIEMRDFILLMYGDHSISIFDTLANEDGTIKTVYNSGDGVHLNDAGHNAIYEKVVEKNIWTVITNISDEFEHLPTMFELKSNYPNPFNPSTTIEFSLPVSSEINVKIYDVSGREVSVLANGKYSAGSYSLNWDASNLSSGIYFYRIIARGNDESLFSKSMKMMLIK